MARLPDDHHPVDPRPSDLVRAAAMAVTAITQVLSAPLTARLLGPTADNGAISDAYPTPVTPAGYAFSIWGLIYAACLALAVYSLLPAQRGRPVHRRTGWWLVGAFTASTVWIPVFGARLFGLAQLVIFALVGCLAVATVRVRQSGPAGTTAERFLFRLPVTLYLGWATLASVAGLALTLRTAGMPERAGWVIALCSALVVAAGVVSVLLVSREVAVAGFGFTACWALVAVGVATTSGPIRALSLLVAVAIAAALAVRAARAARTARAARAEGPGAVGTALLG